MKNLFNYLVIIMILFSASAGVAQDPGTGTITGSVVDKNTGAPIEEAGISIYSVSDSLNVVTGANTDAAGNFTVSNIPIGQYYATINLIGYSTAVMRGINLTTEKLNVDLGKIQLKPGETVTDEILVEEQLPEVQITAEKKIFNVSNDLTLKGGNAIDALRNVPSVSIDQDGNVSLRGSEGVKITVDGKPYGLDGPNRANLLRSISADNIESIEVINNPSAKYEAEGISGIINIVLKKNEGFGYNGTLTVSTSTGDKYNGSFSGNMKKDNLNIFLDYSHNIWTSEFNSVSSRQVFFNSNFPYYDLDADARFRSNSDYVRGGLDYTIDKMNSFTIAGSYNKRNFKNVGSQNNTEYDANRNLANQFITKINSKDDGYNFDLSMNYYKKFKNPKQKLDFEVTYNDYGDDQDGNTINTTIFPQVEPNPFNYNELQDNFTKEINAKLDYTHPIGESSKIETGYQGEFIIDENTYNFDTLNYTTNQYVRDASRSNEFNFDRQVNGVYALLSSGIGENFTYQLGLRAENTNRTGELVTTNQRFDRGYLDFFPSVSLSQKLGAEEEISLNYSRRINRPGAGSLNPFPSFTSGNRNIFTGNPNLESEYINSFELSFAKYFSTTSIIPQIYYRRADNEISRTRTFLDSITTVTMPNNYKSSDTYGAELIFSTRPTSWLSINGSVSYHKTKINADNIAVGLSNENSTGSGRISARVNLPDLFNFQASYFYSGEIAAAQAIIQPFQSFDAAISRDFFDGAATLSFRVSDIFNLSKFDINIQDSQYKEALVFKRDSRVANLSFTFRFGEQDKNQRRRPVGPRDEGGSIGF
jgi:ferric enterobactin receptor